MAKFLINKSLDNTDQIIDFSTKKDTDKNIKIIRKNLYYNIICLFKKLLFTMENATAADSSQSNISRIYIWKDKQKKEKTQTKKKWQKSHNFDNLHAKLEDMMLDESVNDSKKHFKERTYDGKSLDKRETA